MSDWIWASTSGRSAALVRCLGVGRPPYAREALSMHLSQSAQIQAWCGHWNGKADIM